MNGKGMSKGIVLCSFCTGSLTVAGARVLFGIIGDPGRERPPVRDNFGQKSSERPNTNAVIPNGRKTKFSTGEGDLTSSRGPLLAADMCSP
jgi:hypothetical protein